jgi:glucose-1-phosphate thymidylyltransferase
MKIIIPMAGIGKRFFPLTSQRPKPLLRLAEKRLLDHVLDLFRVLEKEHRLEYVFIIGHLGKQIRDHMKQSHPEKKVTYVEQKELMGQSHAVYLAKDVIAGPVLLTYCDTLTVTDFSSLSAHANDGALWVHPVDDPRRHGVAVLGTNHKIEKLIEKPKTMEHKLALTGLCYFPEGKALVKAIETQLERNLSLNSEYYLADAINLLLESGAPIRAEEALQWLDAGTPEAILDTNSYLLRNARETRSDPGSNSSTIFIEPVFVHHSSRIHNSIIGPNVSIGANCTITHSLLQNTIVDDDCDIQQTSLVNSLVGKKCSIHGETNPQVISDHDKVDLVTRRKDSL